MRWILTALLALTLAPALSPTLAAEPLHIRVLTYNIHHGLGSDNELDLERIASLIKQLDPDVVALQEVDNQVQRSGKVDQAQRLGELTGMQHVFGRAVDIGGGQYGLAILSKTKPLSQQLHRLPQESNREARIALEVQLETHDTSWRFVSTHLDYVADPSDRLHQVKELNALFASDNQPTLLAGDLNDTPDSQPLQRLYDTGWTRSTAALEAPLTWPAEAPEMQIDYILYRPASRWRVIESRVIEEPLASDHRPLFAILELQPTADSDTQPK